MFTKEKALALICLGFFFVLQIMGCKNMETTYPYQKYPFKVFKMPPHPDNEPDYGRNYQIWAIDRNGLESVGTNEYGDIFDKYGFAGNGESWREHIQHILEEKDPALLEHLDFDCNADEFLVWADSDLTAKRFLDDVLPIFGSEANLDAHFQTLDPDDFFELE